jgi:hypothetical protein
MSIIIIIVLVIIAIPIIISLRKKQRISNLKRSESFNYVQKIWGFFESIAGSLSPDEFHYIFFEGRLTGTMNLGGSDGESLAFISYTEGQFCDFDMQGEIRRALGKGWSTITFFDKRVVVSSNDTLLINLMNAYPQYNSQKWNLPD